jgi:hypothetical protein
MAQKTDPSLLRSHPDLGADCALVLTTAAAALVALVYLILI